MYASRAKISPDARRHSRKLRNEAQDLPKAHHCIPDRPASPELPSTHPSAQHNTMQPTQPLQRALRRLALTTKMVNKGFYKGNRTGSMGTHTKWGGYTIDYKKVRTYMVPNLENCMVRCKRTGCVLSIRAGGRGERDALHGNGSGSGRGRKELKGEREG